MTFLRSGNSINGVIKPNNAQMVRVNYKGQVYFIDVCLDKQVREMKLEIERITGLKSCQQRLWYETVEGRKVVLLVDKKISESGVDEETILMMKDLGKQLPHRFVYLLEYIGPLTLYFFPFMLSVAMNKKVLVQQYVLIVMWVIHYTKRLLETLYVHEFGDNTMPFKNVFKNCVYYWGFALLVSINVNLFPREVPNGVVIVGCLFMAVSIVSNGYCHLLLKWLRPPGTQIRAIPKGFLFEYASCPHYFCEIMTWVFFNIIAGLPVFGILFSFCGIYQMRDWAIQKHQRYHREFPNYPKNRTVLIPFVY